MEIRHSLLKHSAFQTPTITICSDASWDADLKVGSWACYIRTGDKVVKTGAVAKQQVDNSTEAERIGIANALWLASKIVDLKKYKIVLYCDNLAAMKPVKSSNKTGTKKQKAKEQLAFYEQHIHKYLQQALTYDVRHVKGHLERTARHKMVARHHIQDWCDKKAYELLKLHRESLKKG